MIKKRCLLLLLILLTVAVLPAHAEEASKRQSAQAELLNGGALVSTFYEAPAGSPALFSKSFYEPAYPEAYETILEGLLSRLDEIDVSACRFPKSVLSALYSDVSNSHAELFYVSFGEFYYQMDSNDNVIAIYPTYSEYATEDYINRFHEAASTVLSELADDFEEDMTDVEIALAVHDWLIGYCDYDIAHYESNTVPQLSYTAYGVFVNHTAVCNGYGIAYKYLLNAFGVDCEYIGSRTINHGWNLVKIDGAWYHVDCTWDDPTYGNPLEASHKNFLLNDDEIRATGHIGWEAPVIPECSSDRFSSGYLFNEDSHVFHYKDGAFLFTTPEGLKSAAIDGSGLTTLIDNSSLEQDPRLNENYAQFFNTYFSDYGRISGDLIYGICHITKIEGNRVSLDFGVRVYDLKTGKTKILADGLMPYDYVLLRDGVLSWQKVLLDEEGYAVGTEALGSVSLFEEKLSSAITLHKPLVTENSCIVPISHENVQNSELLVENCTDTASLGMLLICYYDDGVLVDMALTNLSLAAGEKALIPISHHVEVPYDTVQYMVWDPDSISPLCDFVKVL